MEWGRKVINNYLLNLCENVLELGSQNVNGSLREYFNAPNYVGMDFQEGPGVDLIGNAHNIPFADAIFDLVISTEMLEHDDQFWLSLKEINRVLKPNGILLLTARGVNRKNEVMFEHGYPDDYYRFMPNSFSRLFDLFGFEILEIEEDTFHPGWMGLARKEATCLN